MASKIITLERYEQLSYSMNKVVDIIIDIYKKYPDHKIELSPSQYAGIFCVTGCQLKFDGTPYAISIQTDPLICGPALCETALLKDSKVIYGEFGYGDVIRHDTEKEFSEHLDKLFRNIKTPEPID